jgi:hypothetical protein
MKEINKEEELAELENDLIEEFGDEVKWLLRNIKDFIAEREDEIGIDLEVDKLQMLQEIIDSI